MIKQNKHQITNQQEGKMINNNNNSVIMPNTISKKKKLIIGCLKAIGIASVTSFFWIWLGPNTVYAAGFDVTAAGKAMFNPIITFIDTWYGTGIFTAGVGGAVVAAGDLRTRAMGFGVGSVVAGLTLLGVKAGFDVKTVMVGLSNFA